MSEIHLLKVRVNDIEDNRLHPDGTITVQALCPGVSDHCRGWVTCDDPDCDQSELEALEFDGDDNEPVLHGTRHLSITGEYMVPTDECCVVTNGALWEVTEVFCTDNQLGPGDYVVTHEFSDGDLVGFGEHGGAWPA